MYKWGNVYVAQTRPTSAVDNALLALTCVHICIINATLTSARLLPAVIGSIQ